MSFSVDCPANASCAQAMSAPPGIAMTTTAPERRSARPYECFMLGLCLYALMVLAGQAFLKLVQATRQILEWADHGVCLVFFIDFVATLVRTDRRWHYLATWGWIDLVSSIPTIDPLRLGRAARILRIFRVLPWVRATKLLASFGLEPGTERRAACRPDLPLVANLLQCGDHPVRGRAGATSRGRPMPCGGPSAP